MNRTTTFNHLGFPIELIDWPHIEVEGDWVPDVNYAKLEDLIFQLLPMKATKLTGAEIKFIRHHLEMTQKRFSNWLVDKTDDSTVCKWESADLEPTGMPSAMERSIRMQLIAHILEKQRKKTIRLAEVMDKLSSGITNKNNRPIALDAGRFFPIPPGKGTKIPSFP